MNDKNIDVVLEKDIEKLLKSLGYYEDLIEGKLLCSLCGEKLTPQNIFAIYPENSEIKFACDKPDCQKKVKEEQE